MSGSSLSFLGRWRDAHLSSPIACTLAGVMLTMMATLAALCLPKSPGTHLAPGTAHGAQPYASAAVPAPAYASWALTDQAGRPVYPSAMTFAGAKLYFVTPDAVWFCDLPPPATTSEPQALKLTSVIAPHGKVFGIPAQEFVNICYSRELATLIILDKSGDLFELAPGSTLFKLFRANWPDAGPPDPEYIDFAAAGPEILLLDPERNQIWMHPGHKGRKTFRQEIMPWRVRPGDLSIADGIALAYDGDIWVLTQDGRIKKFSRTAAGTVHQSYLTLKLPAKTTIRPSRLVTAATTPLYLVERENNRILSIDKKTGQVEPYLFPATSNLRGLLPAAEGFWLIDGARLAFRPLSPPGATAKPASGDRLEPVNTRLADDRLSGLAMPIHGAGLPRHPGVWPGARRLYRFGVHKGMDFFHDPGHGTYVNMDTPVYAADAGKVTRTDNHFQDMDSQTYSHVIGTCRSEHQSSEVNENLLRGCQVWIDHGSGLVTKYAHLNRVNPALKPGMKVSRGDLVGYIGVSGTGENLPGRAKHPHLHFEVWLDGKYLGYGLNQAETIGIWEDVFGMTRRGTK